MLLMSINTLTFGSTMDKIPLTPTLIINRIWCATYKFLVLQVESINDYDEYCHYVAGLVGIGLSKLFHASGAEDLATDALSNSMGLFLQVIIMTSQDHIYDDDKFWLTVYEVMFYLVLFIHCRRQTSFEII